MRVVIWLLSGRRVVLLLRAIWDITDAQQIYSNYVRAIQVLHNPFFPQNFTPTPS